MSRVPPKRFVFTLAIFLQTLSLCHISAQEYLSECDTSSKPCAKDKFLTCISNKCQCEDPLNQMYEPKTGSCVIMAARKCGGLSSTAELLDPRSLENIKTFPSCGSNAICDSETSTCLCRKGYYHNESVGACELSFGRSCINEDSIIFNSEPDPSKGNGSRTNSSSSLPSSTSKISFLICDKSLGLHCGSEGICKCRDQAAWKIDQGCVVFVDGNNMDKNNLNNNEFGNYDTSGSGGGNFMNLYPGFSYENSYGADEQTPFQQFIDAYTKALIDANNYNFNQNDADAQGTRYNNTTLDNILGGGTINQQKNASANKNNQYVVGDRNEFPGGGTLNQNDQQLLNLLLQQELEKNGNNNVRNKNNQSDVAKLQEQAVQLQKLLIQQQQLQQLLNQLTGDASIPQNQKNSNFATLPTTPSILVPPQNNYLGAGSPNPVQTTGNNYLWNRQQQQQTQPPSLFGGPFPLLRIFRNFIDPIKRRLFPNLADAAYSIPSPIYIMASAVRSFLPVLRAFDQQFSPILDNVVQLTKPRQRAPSAQGTYSNLPLQQQLLQLLTNNNGLGLPNNQQQYQTSQTPGIGQQQQQQQRLFPGRGLLGLVGSGRGRSLNLNVGVSNQRLGRMNNNVSNMFNRNRSLARKLWWW